MGLWEGLSGAFKSDGITIETKTKPDVRGTIDFTLTKTDHLNTKKEHRLVATWEDLSTLLEYLWCNDVPQYYHERRRVQLVRAILAVCYA